MTNDKLLDLMGRIDDDNIMASRTFRGEAAPAKRSFRKAAWRWAAAAAAVVIIAVGAFAVLNRQADDGYVVPPDTETCYRVEPLEDNSARGNVSAFSLGKAPTPQEVVEKMENIIRCKIIAIDEYALPMINTSFEKPPIHYLSVLTCKVIDPIYGDVQKDEIVRAWYYTATHTTWGWTQVVEEGGEYILMYNRLPEPSEDDRFDFRAQTYNFFGSGRYGVFRFDEDGKVNYHPIFGNLDGQAESGTITYNEGQSYGYYGEWRNVQGGGYKADYELVKAMLLDLMAERDGTTPPAATATPVPIEITTPAPETSEKPIEEND